MGCIKRMKRYEVLDALAKQFGKDYKVPEPGANAQCVSTLKRDDQDTVHIKQTDLPLIISDPGTKYVLEESLVFDGSSGAAIFILAPDVVLDLDDHTLSYKAASEDLGTYGVIVSLGSNVTIKNGTIRDFTVMGILVSSSSQVTMDYVRVINNGPTEGIIPGSVEAGGIIVLSSTEIQVTNSHIYQNIGFGIGFGDSFNIYIDGNHVDDNRGLQGFPTGETCYALSLTNTGVPPYNQPNGSVVVKNSTFNRNRSGDTLIGISIYSLIAFQPVIENVLIENCQVFDHKTTSTNPAGNICTAVSVLGRNVVMKNVVVDKVGNSVVGEGSTEVQGLECGGYSAVVENCHVSNVYGISSIENMTGINSEFVADIIVIKDCTVSNIANGSKINPVTGKAQRAVGFNVNERAEIPFVPDFPGRTAIVLNCIAQNITSPDAPHNFAGAGFYFNSLIHGKVKGCISQDNDIGFHFFDLEEPGVPPYLSSENVIEDNEAIGNAFYGFLDETPYAKNAYIKNIARGAGRNNFVGLPGNTPIVIWEVGGPCIFPKAGPFDNLSIVSSAATSNASKQSGTSAGFIVVSDCT